MGAFRQLLLLDMDHSVFRIILAELKKNWMRNSTSLNSSTIETKLVGLHSLKDYRMKVLLGKITDKPKYG